MLIAVQYSSDHFDKLYELAEKLIGLEKAYVCHCGGTWVPVSMFFREILLTIVV